MMLSNICKMQESGASDNVTDISLSEESQSQKVSIYKKLLELLASNLMGVSDIFSIAMKNFVVVKNDALVNTRLAYLR